MSKPRPLQLLQYLAAKRGGVAMPLRADELMLQATAKRADAARVREIAQTLSLVGPRDMLLSQADAIEREALRLEAEAAPDSGRKKVVGP